MTDTSSLTLLCLYLPQGSSDSSLHPGRHPTVKVTKCGTTEHDVGARNEGRACLLHISQRDAEPPKEPVPEAGSEVSSLLTGKSKLAIQIPTAA